MIRKIVVTAALLASTAVVAQPQRASSSCGWLVFSDVTKANAVERQCRYHAQLNGPEPGPKAVEWFNQCASIVSGAIAPCADTDSACVKEKLKPLMGQICDINKRLGSK